MQWLRDSDLDPNDPANADLLDLQKVLQAGAARAPGQLEFRVSQRNAASLDDGGASGSKRLRLCKQRWRESEVEGVALEMPTPVPLDGRRTFSHLHSASPQRFVFLQFSFCRIFFNC